MAMWGTPSEAGPNPRACFLCRQEDHFRRACPWRQRLPPGPCPICKGNHWKAPETRQNQAHHLPGNNDVPSSPIQVPITTVKTEVPWVMLTVKQ
jgi:hypothetical protein